MTTLAVPSMSSIETWRADPATMAHHLTGGGFQLPRHITVLSSILAHAGNTPDCRFIITFPPRHGKTTTASHWFLVWYLMWHPTKQIIFASNEASYAATIGRAVRNILQTYVDQIKLPLATDSKAADEWSTALGGGMKTAGVGSNIMGRGADMLMVDDPIASDEEAQSEVQRQKLWDWWTGTVYHRLEPGASACIIQTRWHHDDLTGRLLKQQADDEDGERWSLVNFPAFAEDDDPLGRKRGEALWPERWTADRLKTIRTKLGNRKFTALYQQRPTAEEGGFFKRQWFRYYTVDSDQDMYMLNDGREIRRVRRSDCWRIITCDTAMTKNDWSDYTVAQVWDIVRPLVPGETANQMILVNQWRAQLETPEVEKVLQQMVMRFKPLWLGIESKNSGKTIIDRFRRDGLPVRELFTNEGGRKPGRDSDKISRAQPATRWMERGSVYFPAESNWIADLESELLEFPDSKHDDQVDTLAYAIIMGDHRNLWTEPTRPDLPPMSYGKLLGMDKVFGPKEEPGPFTIDNNSSNKSHEAYEIVE